MPSRANNCARYGEEDPNTIFFFKINDFLTFSRQNHIMRIDKPGAADVAQTINIDRFTRLKQSIAGKFVPQDLAGLAEYLAGEDGEINYSMTGNLAVDPIGGQERRVKCIIYGWILLFDPVTLAAVRHTLEINSSLILVNDESGLPPLEMESENEDYIVCAANMHVAERIEEEILLSLPVQAVKRSEMLDLRGGRALSVKSAKSVTAPKAPVTDGNKLSPFARLAELKKK